MASSPVVFLIKVPANREDIGRLSSECNSKKASKGESHPKHFCIKHLYTTDQRASYHRRRFFVNLIKYNFHKCLCRLLTSIYVLSAYISQSRGALISTGDLWLNSLKTSLIKYDFHKCLSPTTNAPHITRSAIYTLIHLKPKKSKNIQIIKKIFSKLLTFRLRGAIIY